MNRLRVQRNIKKKKVHGKECRYTPIGGKKNGQEKMVPQIAAK